MNYSDRHLPQTPNQPADVMPVEMSGQDHHAQPDRLRMVSTLGG